ncbi:MAG: tetratricopeptide repeat protein [Desulfuromonadales bacterium]
MTASSFNKIIEQGLIALHRGDTFNALVFFQEAAELEMPPVVLSCLGYCLAKEQGESKKGRALCLDAVQQDPNNALHYLNLGRTYLIAGQKPLAIKTFRKGLKVQRHPGIVAELKKLGLRRQPVFSFLPRENPVNRYVGLIFHYIGLR